ncbi:uncharacterized protein [Choristoneura fumiferana]|uniref:uncharacterized protein n=1 Tax=Choristoneura fumiferana TaxID=7141 RepID=UPI003D15507F
MDILKPGTGFMEVLEVECVKNEPVWESSLSEYAPLEDLYADHKVKQELVIGPELLQQVQQVAAPVIEVTVKIENGETSEEGLRNCNCKDTALPSVAINKVKHNLSQKDLFQVQNCFVKIQRMILHKEQYICKTCGKTFSRRSIFTYHMRRHLKIKTARKEICNAATNIMKQARIHVNKNNTSLKIIPA